MWAKASGKDWGQEVGWMLNYQPKSAYILGFTFLLETCLLQTKMRLGYNTFWSGPWPNWWFLSVPPSSVDQSVWPFTHLLASVRLCVFVLFQQLIQTFLGNKLKEPLGKAHRSLLYQQPSICASNSMIHKMLIWRKPTSTTRQHVAVSWLPNRRKNRH